MTTPIERLNVLIASDCGSIVAQLDDEAGSLVICESIDEADEMILQSRDEVPDVDLWA